MSGFRSSCHYFYLCRTWMSPVSSPTSNTSAEPPSAVSPLSATELPPSAMESLSPTSVSLGRFSTLRFPAVGYAVGRRRGGRLGTGEQTVIWEVARLIGG